MNDQDIHKFKVKQKISEDVAHWVQGQDIRLKYKSNVFIYLICYSPWQRHFTSIKRFQEGKTEQQYLRANVSL